MKNPGANLLFAILPSFFEKTGFWIICLFTFVFPLKFGLPYTYNIDQGVPGNLMEMFFESWPVEWGILLLLLALICYLISGGKEGGRTRLDIVILVWTAFVLASAYIHGIYSHGLETALLLASYSLYYFLVKLFSITESRRILLFYCALAAMILTLGYGFYQYYEGLEDTLKQAMAMNIPELTNTSFVTRLSVKKIFSTFIYSNTFAGYLILWIPPAICCLALKQRRKYAFHAAGTAFVILLLFLLLLQKFSMILIYAGMVFAFPISIFYLLFLTKSKGAMLILLIAGGLSLVSTMRTKRLKKIVYFSLTFLFLVGGYTLRNQIGKSAQVRADYNAATWGMIQDYPFWGIGCGNYGTYYMHYKRPEAEEVQLAHNSLFQIWAECGLPAFLALLMMLFYSLKNCFSEKGGMLPAMVFFPVFLAAILHNLIDFDLYVPGVGYLIFYFFAIADTKEETQGSAVSVLSIPWKGILRMSGVFASLILMFLYYRFSMNLTMRNKGMLFLENGKNDYAVACFESAINYYPFTPVNYINLGDLHCVMGNWEKASFCYRKALELLPENSMSWIKLARSLIQKELREKETHENEILTAFNNAINYYPANKEIRDELNTYLKNRSSRGNYVERAAN